MTTNSRAEPVEHFAELCILASGSENICPAEIEFSCAIAEPIGADVALVFDGIE
jgi:hypothetical protein